MINILTNSIDIKNISKIRNYKAIRNKACIKRLYILNIIRFGIIFLFLYIKYQNCVNRIIIADFKKQRSGVT
jgi:hypothetical protein